MRKYFAIFKQTFIKVSILLFSNRIIKVVWKAFYPRQWIIMLDTI